MFEFAQLSDVFMVPDLKLQLLNKLRNEVCLTKDAKKIQQLIALLDKPNDPNVALFSEQFLTQIREMDNGTLDTVEQELNGRGFAKCLFQALRTWWS